MSTTQPDYQFFNRFQSYFYTSVQLFDTFTNYEIKQNVFVLLTNMSKGFPNLANDIMSVYSPEIKFDECPTLIRALQRKFVNDFSRPRVPQFIYYKSQKSKVKKPKVKKLESGMLEFSEDIELEIKSILMYDEKTFRYLRHSKKVQELGKQLAAEFERKEIIRINKTKQK